MSEPTPFCAILKKIMACDLLSATETVDILALFQPLVCRSSFLYNRLKKHYGEDKASALSLSDGETDVKPEGSAYTEEADADSMDASPHYLDGHERVLSKKSRQPSVTDAVTGQALSDLWIHFSALPYATPEYIAAEISDPKPIIPGKSVWQQAYEKSQNYSSETADSQARSYLYTAAKNYLTDLCWNKTVKYAISRSIAGGFRKDSDFITSISDGEDTIYCLREHAEQADALPLDPPPHSLDIKVLQKNRPRLNKQTGQYARFNVALPTPTDIKFLFKAACVQLPCRFSRRGLVDLVMQVYELNEEQVVEAPGDTQHTDADDGSDASLAASRPADLGVLSSPFEYPCDDEIERMMQDLLRRIAIKDKQQVNTCPGQEPGGPLAHLLADYFIWEGFSTGFRTEKFTPNTTPAYIPFKFTDYRATLPPVSRPQLLNEQRDSLMALIKEALLQQTCLTRDVATILLSKLFDSLRTQFMHRMPEKIRDARLITADDEKKGCHE